MARLLITLCLMVGCVAGDRSAADTRVRTALDILAQVIDPAYSVAMDGCAAPQEVATARAEAGLTTAAAARAVIDQVRARCDQVREGFETIRLHHDEARRSVASGELGRAEKLLEQIRADWVALRGGAS